MELNTTNPHCFIYQTEELLVELLGGIRIDGLDRMRVTMKITAVKQMQQSARASGITVKGSGGLNSLYQSVIGGWRADSRTTMPMPQLGSYFPARIPVTQDAGWNKLTDHSYKKR